MKLLESEAPSLMRAEVPEYTRIDGEPVSKNFHQVVEGVLRLPDGERRHLRLTFAPTFLRSMVEVDGEAIPCKSAWVEFKGERPMRAGYRYPKQHWWPGESRWHDVAGALLAD